MNFSFSKLLNFSCACTNIDILPQNLKSVESKAYGNEKHSTVKLKKKPQAQVSLSKKLSRPFSAKKVAVESSSSIHIETNRSSTHRNKEFKVILSSQYEAIKDCEPCDKNHLGWSSISDVSISSTKSYLIINGDNFGNEKMNHALIIAVSERSYSSNNSNRNKNHDAANNSISSSSSKSRSGRSSFNKFTNESNKSRFSFSSISDKNDHRQFHDTYDEYLSPLDKSHFTKIHALSTKSKFDSVGDISVWDDW
jgi:hypothetical protein